MCNYKVTLLSYSDILLYLTIHISQTQVLHNITTYCYLFTFQYVILHCVIFNFSFKIMYVLILV